ncbi:MAG: flippase [Nanoarchaeota archaeon]
MAGAIVKGTIYLMVSVFVFFLANYVLHIAIGRFLGPEMYGVFGVLMSLYLISDAFFGTGLPKAVSKFMSEHEDKKKYIYKVSLRLQLILTVIFSSFFIVFAKQIALILNDESLTNYIVFIGVMMISLSLLSLYSCGFFNGLRKFKQQALIRIVHVSLRTILALLFLYLGFRLFGVLTAFLISQVVALIYCVFYFKSKLSSKEEPLNSEEKKTIGAKKIFMFSLPIVAASLTFTLVRNINILFIKSFLVDNYLVGLFTAAATLSNLPFLVFAPVSLTLLPSISKAASTNNMELIKKYISQSTRYILILLLPIIAITMTTSKEVLRLLYSADYVAGADVLSILLVSSTFLTISSALSSVITGMGKPRFELYYSILFLSLLSILNFFLIPKFELIGAAYAFLITAFIVLLMVGIYIYYKFKTLLNFISFLRIMFCSIIIYTLAYLWPIGGFLLLLKYSLLFLLYLFLLYVFGEIKEEDWSLVRQLIKIK